MKKIFLFLCFFITFCIFAEEWGKDFWETNEKGQSYFVQPTFDPDYAIENAFNGPTRTIRARVNKKWHKYILVSLPNQFLDWNIGLRKENI